MDEKPTAYHRIKRKAAKRRSKGQQSQQWKTIVASGLIGLFGALIGGGVTFATTSRQIASQAHLATDERAHQDQLNRIARRDDIYSAFYATVVEFRDSTTEFMYRDSLPLFNTSTAAAVQKETDQIHASMYTERKRVSAHLTSLSFVGSTAVNQAANETSSCIDDILLFNGPATLTDKGIKAKRQQASGRLDASMVKLLAAMRGDLNFTDVVKMPFGPQPSLEP